MTAAIERALKMADLCRRWGVSQATILRHIHNGTLLAIDLGVGSGRRQYRFPLANVTAAEERLRVQAATKAKRTPKPRVSEETRRALEGRR